jgi:GMP synthase-like glutamine amidotransferase
MPTETSTPPATSTTTSTPTATATDTPTATANPERPLRIIALIHGPARALPLDNVLNRFGVTPTNIRVDRGEVVPDLRDYDGVLFAGGEYRPEEFTDPLFDNEQARILEAVEAGVPILGICLGHQLLVHWLGGEVKRGQWEAGWLPIVVHEEGQDDPLLAGLGDQFYAFLWHGDEITRLPEEAVLLASSELTRVQAYRLGDRPVWGVQFNPQYDPVMAEEVIRGSTWLVESGQDIEELVAIGYRMYNDLAGTIVGNFLEVVRTR